MRRGGFLQSRRTSPRRSSAAVSSYPLDVISIPASAAYSMRLLRAGYTGALLRLQRDGDNAQQDFYPASNGYVDKAAILAFAGAVTARVIVLYDQSGNGRHTAPGVSAPSIVTNTVWQNGFAKYGGLDQTAIIPSSAFTGATSLSVSTIYQRISGQPGPHQIGFTGNAYHYPWGDTTIYSGFGLNARPALSPGGVPTAPTAPQVITDSVSSSGLLRVFFDNVLVASGSGVFQTPSNRRFPGGETYGECLVRELILFGQELSASDRAVLTASQYAARGGLV